jgi:hypothetical protein
MATDPVTATGPVVALLGQCFAGYSALLGIVLSPFSRSVVQQEREILVLSLHNLPGARSPRSGPKVPVGNLGLGLMEFDVQRIEC